MLTYTPLDGPRGMSFALWWQPVLCSTLWLCSSGVRSLGGKLGEWLGKRLRQGEDAVGLLDEDPRLINQLTVDLKPRPSGMTRCSKGDRGRGGFARNSWYIVS